MKNAIKYYYNLNPIEIHQINKSFKFEINNKKFILEPYNKNIEDLKDIYELQSYLIQIGFPNNKIVLNNNKEVLTYINGINYILEEVYVDNKQIDINDIMLFNNINVYEKKLEKLKRNNWYELWTNKIDYVEYQISQFGKKYEIIRETSNYFIGMVENCIQLLSMIEKKQSILTLSHNRTTIKKNKIEYYDPINFIIDNKVRDISEYIKSCILDEIDVITLLDNYVYYSKLNTYEINLLFIRILYPSYYIDMCENIIEGKIKEENLKQITNNIENIEYNIKLIYDRLRKICNIPEIEWLTKK